MRICAAQTPTMTEVAANQHSACWLHATGLDSSQATPLKTPQAQAPGKET
jgi:hypothetical protein